MAPQTHEPVMQETSCEATGLRILVVEDNADCALIMAMLLRREGHEVRIAGDAAQAMREAGASRPDVVVLDIGLPTMSGHDLAEWLRRHQPGLAPMIIVVTGYANESRRRRSLEVGVDLHLVKPFPANELLAPIRRFQQLVRRSEGPKCAQLNWAG